VTLGIHAGEFVSVIGPNRAGKSTLINVLTGLLKACRGSLNGLDNLHIARAATEIAGDGRANLQLARLRVVSQEGHGGHNHAGGAIAALQIDELTALMACCREWPR